MLNALIIDLEQFLVCAKHWNNYDLGGWIVSIVGKLLGNKCQSAKGHELISTLYTRPYLFASIMAIVIYLNGPLVVKWYK